ncbi:hypothetical protein CFC21_105738 [Triticum aestivum]|uniref:F-box domain-containing protein n=3 Tax=Triticum TaxID=4564 RepID=A0A9R1AD86_TRITD|nr:uncharacterized protein LOC123160600 [Triticum aestivum]KAF7104875.1 hypothetical protein CFC21_105738 [Triticum aestivum]VAI93617.1 unnamed protein product [Triticum turgidum subsp. durum]
MESPAPPFPDAPPTPAFPDAPAAPPCSPDSPPTVETQATLPDHLAEEILLRVPTAADLARASMAGPSLRRLIADHAFLRRFRTLHPPPLLGILLNPFLPAQPPHPSAAAAQTLAGTDFSCSFLPSREQPWTLRDFRDGRALLCAAPDDCTLARDVAVCDPLHRRYLLLPPVPQDLSDLVYHCQLFLAPAATDDGADTAADASMSFRVICLAKYQAQLVLFVFSSSGPLAQQWHTTVFDGWSALIAETSQGDDMRSATAFGKRYYVHGCFCWAIPGINKLLMLDIRTMDFSSVNLPPIPWFNSQVAFVEATEGRLGMLILSDNRFLHTILVSIGDDPKEWQIGDVVTLRHGCCYYSFIGAAGGYLLLQGFPDDPYEMPGTDCFSLNLQIMKLERFCGKEFMMPLQGHLYVGFPPSLSPPTI